MIDPVDIFYRDLDAKIDILIMLIRLDLISGNDEY